MSNFVTPWTAAYQAPLSMAFSRQEYWSGMPSETPKNWSFHFSINPSNEYSGLISFRIDWLDLLVFQRTLSSLLQHHSSKASVLQHLAFLIAQLSHLYVTTEKTIALTTWTFVGKVMSLLLNMLSRLVIAFLPRRNLLFLPRSLLIS